jgi:hypothetical protein
MVMTLKIERKKIVSSAELGETSNKWPYKFKKYKPLSFNMVLVLLISCLTNFQGKRLVNDLF